MFFILLIFSMRYVLAIWFYLLGLAAQAQTDELYQLWNEYTFRNEIGEKWEVEFDTGFVASSTVRDNNAFHSITQYYIRGWAHYNADERWKLSGFYAHYSNKNVPELNQVKTREFRSAIQATYSLIVSNNFNMNLRARIEDRHLENAYGNMEAVERFRLQIKAIYALKNNNSAIINNLYFFASEEVVFKSKSHVGGPDLFDRNRASLGIGCKIMKDVKMETDYINEIMPRNGTNKQVDAFRIRFIFNNFFSNFGKSDKIKKKVFEHSDIVL